jgi:hypothetical protein
LQKKTSKKTKTLAMSEKINIFAAINRSLIFFEKACDVAWIEELETQTLKQNENS